MNIHIYDLSTAKTSATILEIPTDLLPSFKQLVNRAMNTWVDAPAELKEFADKLIHGKILQDYKAQEHSKPRSE